MLTELALAALALAAGGVLKGATGAGAPLIAVPALAAIFDVQVAVTLMVMPNLLTNLAQVWVFRRDRIGGGLWWLFAGAGAVGAALGSLALAYLPPDALERIAAAVILAYVALRLARPEWRLALATALRLAVPVGLLAGVMQGASGISAPVSITFLSALRPSRAAFIGTISVFFVAMSLVQLPALWALGLVDGPRLLAGLAAIAPIVAAMPLGNALARRLSAATFDRILPALLCLIAAKLILWQAL